jgi:hypothetical protein
LCPLQRLGIWLEDRRECLVTYQLVVRPYLFDRITQVANTATALQVNLRSAVLVASSKLWPGFSNQGCWAYRACSRSATFFYRRQRSAMDTTKDQKL